MTNTERPFVFAVVFSAILIVASLPFGVAAEKDAAAAAQQVAGVRFDRGVFGRRDIETVEAAQIRLNRSLQQRIDAVDRYCGLTDAQKKKLELVGRGAIRQLFLNIDAQKQTFIKAEMSDLEAARFLYESPEIGVLRAKLRSSLFDDESVFAKTIRNTLTPEQIAKYDMRSSLATTSSKRIDLANARDMVRISKLPKDAFEIDWHRDGKHVGLLEFNQHVEVYLPPGDQVVQSFGKGKKLVGFDFSPQDNLVAIAENSQDALIINVTEGKEIPLHTGQSQPSVKFSPAGKLLVTGGYGTTAKLWSVATGELIRTFDVGPVEGGLTPVFSPDGTILAVGNRNSSTRLFDVASGQLLRTLHIRSSHGLSFDPTGKILAVVYVDAGLILWDVQTGDIKRRVQAQAEELYRVAWTPDGSVLVTAGYQTPVTFWNPADLSIVGELEAPEWVMSAKFSPDGTKLMIAGGNRGKAEKRVETWAVP